MKTTKLLIIGAAFALVATMASAATFTVTNTAASGAGSLRQAIIDSNNAGGTNTIAFNIPGGGVQTINAEDELQNGLPAFLTPTTIDGYTQPGSSSNTLATGNNAVLLIELFTTNNINAIEAQAEGCLTRGLVLNGFYIAMDFGIGGQHSAIEGCFIGTDATGTNASSRATTTGVYSSAPGNNRIGGTNRWQRNIISACDIGVDLYQSTNNLVAGNYFGTDKSGTHAVPNVTGIQIESPRNFVTGNLISGNSGTGLAIYHHETTVQGNLIGTDATGTSALGNSVFGVSISGGCASNLIGGATVAARNVISGNANTGVLISGFDNQIMGNYVGTDVTGTQQLPNGNGGINLSSGVPTGNQISGNLIVGNVNYGLSFFLAENNLADGNTIESNVGDGVLVNGTGNVVSNNAIALNTGSGIFVPNNSAFTNNTFTGNSISANGVLGIDLRAPGENIGVPNTNDVCDADDGANHVQNYPVLTLASNGVSGISIHGTLNSAASTTFRIEFFANGSCSTSGFGEGELYLGSTNVTTSGGCSASISAHFTNQLTFCDFITATASDPDGNTSEFSQCVQVQAPGVVANTLLPAVATNVVNTSHTVTNTLTADAAPLIGETVFFNVTGGPNSGKSATNTTDNAGVALFTYTGSGGTGSDTIRAVSTYCAGAVTSTATKVWTSGGGGSNVPPVALCQDVTAYANSNCQASVSAASVDNGSYDTNGVSVTLHLIPPGPFDLGTNNVTLWATDVDGASNSCSAVVIVRDTNAPSIQCSGNIVSNIASPATSTPVTYAAPTVDDNCGVATNYCLPASGSTFSLGTNTVTCTAVDNSGNTNTCSFTVTVQQGVCAVDLTGTWTNLVQTCKFKNEVPSCKVKGTLNVRDIGTQDAGSSFIHYFLSDDATLDKGDVLLKQVNTGSVKVSKVKKRTLSAKLPVGVDGTGKYIIAFIDVNGDIAECDEENNIVVFGPLP